MHFIEFFTQPHSFIVDVILTGFKYAGYLLGVGAIMNILGMGKVFDYLIKLFAEVMGYVIGFVARRGYCYVIRPVFRKILVGQTK